MYKPFRLLTYTFVFSFLILTGVDLILAQTVKPPPPPPPLPVIKGHAIKDAPKIPGATVTGRAVYEDSGLPLRFSLIGLVKVDGMTSYYSTKFVRTDENGEFTLEDVEAGDYYAYFKNDGILNPDEYKKLNRFDPDSIKPEEIYQKISVNGAGQFQVFVRAKRGSSFSGIVRYFDGEAAVDVRVEALRKLGDKFLAYPIGNVKTDDRGYYRFAGLPEGSYTVRVFEPASHKNEEFYYDANDSGRGGLLKTYYPQSQTAKDASGFDVFLGQEQTSIDVTLPERQLFDVFGKVVLKQTGEPLKNFRVIFSPVIEEVDGGLTYGSGNSLMGGASSGISSSAPDIPSDWSLRNLPKGKYRITATQVRTYGEKAKNQVKYPDVSKEIEIVDGNLENVFFEVPTASRIKGIIVSESGKPISQYVRIYAYNIVTKARGVSESAYSKEKSKKPVTQIPFTIDKLTAGKIKLIYGDRGFYIRSISVNNRAVNDQVIELEEGESLENIRIVLASDMGTLKGKIDNFDPNDLTSIVLFKKGAVLDFPSADSFFGRAKQDGTYSIKAKPGVYSIVVMARSKSPTTREEYLEFMKTALNDAPTVTITKDKTTNLNLDLPN